MALKGRPLVVPRVMSICDEARTALMLAILGVFCCGPIFGSMAVAKGSAAKKIIQADDRLVGSGMATTAITIGVIDVVIWLISLVQRVNSPGVL